MMRQRGFTLIESIVVMVIIGLAMVTLVSFLYPQVERSATPHYQTRAANLGQSMMSQILALGFDENSDFDGGFLRCGEAGAEACTPPESLGRDGNSTPGESSPDQFNDVDDYIGCWYSDRASDCGSNPDVYPLANVLGQDVSANYRHFTVTVAVSYAGSNYQPLAAVTALKQIRLTVDTGGYGQYQFVAYRGNY
ncbi:MULTISPECIES: prepilin-type N-terminal cleavage/methylation domain-containing protein [Vibrio]|uniref:Prepilin-type N-terminal cleavage/methylation domain-containing protein n=1 Tax=Vibrio ostreae TaxID=2841925 RepID=A0A975U8M2_9VIBR|nr:MULTISPECIES: prepilin-type N-terminal cleavage/methylation domain-containing protein [Vibrio]QXO17108.1 prepilin-type N-terminal cleavage/methylation domain-containing protein [Vibrio ostreae]WGY48577.1 prepilin-type N-terminal cleavage/methylation domain-containing protein [Vibrio sp. ABG19]